MSSKKNYPNSEPQNQKPYMIYDIKSFENWNMRTHNENPQYKVNKNTHLYRTAIFERNFTANKTQVCLVEVKSGHIHNKQKYCIHKNGEAQVKIPKNGR